MIAYSKKQTQDYYNYYNLIRSKSISKCFPGAKSNDPRIELREMKIQCPQKIIVGHLNINSISNEFDVLSLIIGSNKDIMLISETKRYDSFPLAQFRLKGLCTPYKLERNSKRDRPLL